MSSEVTVQEKPKEQKPKPVMASGGAVKAIVPQDFEGAWRIAELVCAAGMAPRGLTEPPQAMVAILHGLEVGFTPMAALQSIAVINGRPSIWGDGALALIEASGKLEHFEETITGEGDARIATCKIRRKNRETFVYGKFSVDQAKKAQLWSKSGPWTQYPERMLQMRARAFALRDAFSDILRGLSIAEEVSDYAKDVSPDSQKSKSTPPRPPEETKQETAKVDQKTETKVIDGEVVDKETGEVLEADTKAKTVDKNEKENPSRSNETKASEPVKTEGKQEPESSSDEFDAEAFLDELEAAINKCKTVDDVHAVWEEMDVDATLTHDVERMGMATSLKNGQIGMLK